jgi:uncharacterized protein
MGADVNIKIIEGVYDAFSRGDVAAILEVVTEDVDWASETTSTALPWYGDHRGKDGVSEFFRNLGSTMEVDEFVPLSYAANDRDVLTVVRFRATLRSNGRRVAMDLHHQFTFRDGKIAYYRGTEDTAQTEAASRA